MLATIWQVLNIQSPETETMQIWWNQFKKISWNHIKYLIKTYFWRILVIWNHSGQAVLCQVKQRPTVHIYYCWLSHRKGSPLCASTACAVYKDYIVLTYKPTEHKTGPAFWRVFRSKHWIYERRRRRWYRGRQCYIHTRTPTYVYTTVHCRVLTNFCRQSSISLMR